MPETGRSLLRKLLAGPVPIEEVDPEARTTLAAANVEYSTRDGALHLDTIPAYGWAAIVADLAVPIGIEFHETIPSTNDRARSIATAGDRDVAVVAAEQTGGQGRRDRSWESPRGGVWCSIVFTPTLQASHRSLLQLAGAVAVAETAAEIGVNVGIKWPNDVLVPDTDGPKKLAGILSESGTDEDGRAWVVVGIGLNADIPPEALPPDATSLRIESGRDIDRATTVQRLLASVWKLRAAPETIRTSWRDRSLTLGQVVRIETDTRTLRGRAVDITETGALAVETDSGREVVSAGDCDHLRPE